MHRRGIEPLTSWFVARYSIQLSYRCANTYSRLHKTLYQLLWRSCSFVLNCFTIGFMMQVVMEKYLEPSWFEVVKEEFAKPYMERLSAFVRKERGGALPVYPPGREVFASLELSPYDKTRVVIVGQDPYHGPGQAHGLCFSVRRGVRPPPSLQNIYKEIQDDLGIAPPTHGCLEGWARQGVLLLNATLTVRAGEPGSHTGQGWELFTDKICEILALRPEPTVFLLWGKFAQEKVARVFADLDTSHHLVLQAAHPSPFAAHNGFFGCRHFSKTNHFLESKGLPPINWELK